LRAAVRGPSRQYEYLGNRRRPPAGSEGRDRDHRDSRLVFAYGIGANAPIADDLADRVLDPYAQASADKV